MGSGFGRKVRIQIFGESHGKIIGGIIDGLPSGEKISLEELELFMSRRAPGRQKTATSRREPDRLNIVSGYRDGYTTGDPMAVLIENTDVRSGDYEKLSKRARPGHVDYPLFMQTGDYGTLQGGGHYSGRLTAPICALGGMAKQLLEARGIFIGAHIARVGDILDEVFDPVELASGELTKISTKKFPVLSDERGEEMIEKIVEVKSLGDSLGGVVECAVVGLPVGLGWGIFDKVESRLSQGIFSIGGVKGVEFGDGFQVASALGSENNDAFVNKNGKVRTKTNHAGGILGGKTTGMPLIFRAAFKPTPTISKDQDFLDLETMEVVHMSSGGRHDPCIVPRAVPVVEAMTALVLLDMLLEV